MDPGSQGTASPPYSPESKLVTKLVLNWCLLNLGKRGTALLYHSLQ